MAKTHDDHIFVDDVTASIARPLSDLYVGLPEGVLSTDVDGNWITYPEAIKSATNQVATKNADETGKGLVRDITDGNINFLDLVGNKGIKVSDTVDLQAVILDQDGWFVEEGDYWAEKLPNGLIRQGGKINVSPINLNVSVPFLVPFPSHVVHVELSEVKEAERVGHTLRVLNNRENPAEDLTVNGFSIGVDVTDNPSVPTDNGWVTWMALGY